MLANLYTETEYSLLHSPSSINNLVNEASKYGYNALAITDVNNMHGVIKFYNKCKSANIKPIIGLHFNRNDINLLLYAKTNVGYKNLMALATIAKTNRDEEIKLNDLKDYSSDIICVIPSIESTLYNRYKVDKNEFLNRFHEINNIFKETYFGLNLQTVEIKEEASEFVQFLDQYNINMCEINKCSYESGDYFEAYVYLNSIASGGSLYPYSEMEMNLELLNKVEKEALYLRFPKLLENSEKIIEECNVEIGFSGFKMPKFESTVKDKDEYLFELSRVGLLKRLSQMDEANRKKDEVYKNRLLYELKIIKEMGFTEYFLIVYDYVKYAKTHDILVGPGRGSGAGSLVAYSLGITDVDPIKYDLMFERFLNPERKSMPDIDTDFPDIKRDEVIRYMGNKYGIDRVCHICTFDTFGAKSAIRDVARVMKLDDKVLNEILKNIPNGMSLDEARNEKKVLAQMISEYEDVAKVYDIVTKIEGLPRHTSIHASGIVMADSSLSDYVPMMDGMNGLYETQYPAEDLEFLGLVKFDFLGIRNLTTISNVIDQINKYKKFTIKDIDYNDKKVFDLIASGDTDGLFQLESGGMRETLKRIKVSSLEDIIASISLYRPGPMEMISTYVNRKFGKEKITYLHPSLEEVLKPTYGIIIYQEQIILIAQKFAGYSLGEADILRRAVSKKKEELILEERKNFVSRSKALGRSEADANTIYDYIVKFANYGFNRSHAAVYSVVAYMMAYLKTYYFKEFMGEMMANSLGKNQSLKSYINSCERKNIKVFLPSINKSTDRFEITNEGIYYSLLGIKEVGKISYDNFSSERDKNGEYKTYDEFISRTKSIFSKNVVINLINSGALDEFKIPRKQMTLEYDNSLALSQYGGILVGKLSEREFSDEEYSFEEIAKNEKDALGFNIKFDIFKRYSPLKSKYQVIDMNELKMNVSQNVMFTLLRYREIETKNKKKMAFLTIGDETKELDAVLFTDEYLKYKDILRYGKVYLGRGKPEERNENIQIVLEKIVSLN